MKLTRCLVYDIRPIADATPIDGRLRILFQDESTAWLDASHPNYETLRVTAESVRGRPVPVGILLDGEQITDLNVAHDTAIQSIIEDPADPGRLKVSCWGYSPVCYLTRDHPEFTRLRSLLAGAAGTQTRVWLVNHSEMVEDEPKAEGEEFEVWWKIMDVRPMVA